MLHEGISPSLICLLLSYQVSMRFVVEVRFEEVNGASTQPINKDKAEEGAMEEKKSYRGNKEQEQTLYIKSLANFHPRWWFCFENVRNVGDDLFCCSWSSQTLKV